MGFFAVGVVVSACASVGHTWQDEFTARLEGASASFEEALDELRTETSDIGYPQTFIPLARTLSFKAELIEELDPPEGCQAVQEQGLDQVQGFAGDSSVIPRSMTPELERRLPAILKDEIGNLETLEREAETCATG